MIALLEYFDAELKPHPFPIISAIVVIFKFTFCMFVKTLTWPYP